jgi:catechol 2,3-dioxygenase-like lactoylglutathione lyase family enzyme
MSTHVPAVHPDTYVVGGVRLPRPFRIRRLGHFGVNVADPEVTRGFYERLLGFRISDKLDLTARFKPEEVPNMGPMVGYFTRHGTDHHSFVFFPKKALSANYKHANEFPEVTTNQITWQVGSLREVVDGFDYFKQHGLRIHRAGRDSPGSNWHTYPFDPDGHVNEVYYGIEQIGWDGYSKPQAMHEFRYTEPPGLPHRSEFAEVAAGHARGVDPTTGWQQIEPLPETYDVGGVLLARPFKVVRVGPVRLFVKDMARALAFYRDVLGLAVTEEVTWNGHRCVFLRANTEHHSLALYPVTLRAELDLNPNTTLFSFGIQVADYAQLKGALGFLGGHKVAIKHLPPELFPGIDYSAFAIDPDGHAVQVYYAMEQVGWDGKARPAASRPKIDNANWPETVEPGAGAFVGEPYLGPWN